MPLRDNIYSKLLKMSGFTRAVTVMLMKPINSVEKTVAEALL